MKELIEVKMDKKVSLYFKEFLDAMRVFQKAYDFAYGEVNCCDKTTQDLLHQLELGTYDERSKTATALANIRKKRRTHKDMTLVLQSFIDLMNTETGKAFAKALQKTLGETRKVESSLQNRQYYPRVLQQLQICQRQYGDGANE